MDLSETPAESSFRASVREALTSLVDHWPAPPGGRFDSLADEVAWGREWQRRLASERLVGVAWPAEYGGRGAGPIEHFIVQEELARARAPELVGRIGVNLAGPTLLQWGTPEQQARWLPSILAADVIVCQLFSEPGAGSDLASVSTRAEAAVVDGVDGWVLNGQKVWTSYAQFADWGVCLARTDPAASPRHRGISYLVVDMHAPGVEVRPLRQLTDEAEFNEVFFSDVFVPSDCLVGAVNEGWRVANATLTHERGTNPRQLVIHIQLLEELLSLGADGATSAFDDDRLRRRLADAYVEVKLFQLANLRSLSALSAGREPGRVGSSLKLYWSEMSKRLHDTAMAVVGPSASPLWRGADGNPGDGRWQRSWLYYQASSIWAGTNEIQRNVLAERVLGLPRE
ncbi:MAG TPA: acyl-CoA dehydrogenase family protein [Acidimicrobiales bacterium]|nr:acyl-CoA dehydrogenase family protein [Acidimicrobiales bacterium]